MDHHENFHSVVEKKVRITFPLSHQNRSQHESTVFFQKLILRNCCPAFSCKKNASHVTMCLTCSNMFKINFQKHHNITIHLGCPKQIAPNMFRALSPSTRAHSQVSTCANFYSTLPIFNRIQAEAGVIR